MLISVGENPMSATPNVRINKLVNNAINAATIHLSW